jgi:dephospho-CoA kinase
MSEMPANTNRVIVGISGRIGSGKSDAAHYLEDKYGLQYLRYSLVLAEWQKADPAGKAGLQEIGWNVMGGDHQRELNDRLVAKFDPTRDVVVDGLRHPIDADCLFSVGRKAILLYIDTPVEDRFKRLRTRFASWDEFMIADTHPVESHIEELKGRATALIDGAVLLEQFYKAIDDAVKADFSRSNK